ncbi:MAG: Eco29kI family restriction endonuclease [Phycisphaeraceae bacterium]
MVDYARESPIIAGMANTDKSDHTFDLANFTKILKAFLKQIPENMGEVAHRRGQANTGLVKTMHTAIRRLDDMLDELDPVRQPVGRIELFAPATIGRLIGRELESLPLIPLAKIQDFYGAGIYAIYYRGKYPAYAPISGTECPIYVGKGDPDELHTITPREQGKGISRRLHKHRDNIEIADNLDLADFFCRYLATESGWQMTAESFLIALYHPVWNKETGICQGFGKHGDKARTELSKWDVLHGGRGWAKGQTSRRGYTVESVNADIQKHFLSLLESDRAFWTKLLNTAWLKTVKR